MFTGIIDHIGTIVASQPTSVGRLLRIASRFEDLTLGESIAVDGVCLTVMAIDGKHFDVQVSPETLAKTTLSGYPQQQTINLERAMCLNDRVGGHLVTGHVDETIVLARKISQDAYCELFFSTVSNQQQCYLIPKGSVTINGVSLTVNAVDASGFSVMLVPHTLANTTLSQLNATMHVNVEWDYVAKIVAKQVTMNEKQTILD
jgi:riboflavin synthase